MTRDALLSEIRRWLRLLPALVLHDPIFRYAAIAAALALLLVIGRVAQDWAGPGPISSPIDSAAVNPRLAPTAQQPSPRPNIGSLPAPPTPAPTVAPGRPLDGIKVEPAPADSFGTLPAGKKQP